MRYHNSHQTLGGPPDDHHHRHRHTPHNDKACQEHGIDHRSQHKSAGDVAACAKLLDLYLQQIKTKNIQTYGDLTRLAKYKFFESFDNSPLPRPFKDGIYNKPIFRSRGGFLQPTPGAPQPPPLPRNPLATYWDELCVAVTDLDIDDQELESLVKLRNELNLHPDQIRFLHAHLFSTAVLKFISDRSLTTEESNKLRRLKQCLQTLGWSPGGLRLRTGQPLEDTMEEPSIYKTAFSCPHCGAYTSQEWHQCFVKSFGTSEKRTPFLPDSHRLQQHLRSQGAEPDVLKQWTKWAKDMESGQLFVGNQSSDRGDRLDNLFLSQCYNCNRWAVWIHELLVHPHLKQGDLPNSDLPDEVLQLVEEARSITDLSPRGAAALLRLAIQHLCVHLGGKGKNINDDIGFLVKRGLNPDVQKALDIVRVVGNEAVHPGQLNVNDSREIAKQLFMLINIIAQQMITQPKQVSALYDILPSASREAIAKRDASALDNQE